MALNPLSFGKQNSFNGKKVCEPRFIHVPLRFTAAASAAGARVYQDTIDLLSFVQGAPSKFVDGIQTLVAYQRGINASGNLTNDAFLSEMLWTNGFRCIAPGKAFTTISVLLDNSPTATLNVYTQAALAGNTAVEIDFYFCNFAVDEISFNLPTF